LTLQGDAAAATPATTIALTTGTGTALTDLGLSAGSQTAITLAQDAKVTIDGIQIVRSSNSISDGLSGVTMDLKQADATTTLNMNIGIDTAALQANVQTFVDGYNTVMDFINSQYTIDSTTGKNGVLAADPLLGSIQSSMSSALLQSLPSLASDRNSLVMVGVEPDASGHLLINPDLFDNFLNTDPTAIRDVFVAKGSSTNTQLQFLTTGFTTPSGTYAVNIPTQAATKSGLQGITSLTGGLAANETVTLTETSSGHLATIPLTLGQTQSQVIAALNAELDTTYTETRKMGTSLGAGVSGASTFASLASTVAAGDTITIGGTDRLGSAITGTFTVLDPATDTISDLLSSIQASFSQQVVASVDASGNVQVSDAQSGDSQLTLSLVANNEGASSSLNFGADTQVTNGRYAMGLVAVAAAGGTVDIQAKNYGSGQAFSITQTTDGLGIANQTATDGLNVAGTIGGEAATGRGQLLTGTAGNVDGMSVLYTGTATGVVGSIDLGVGIGANYDGLLDTISNNFTGLIMSDIQSMQTNYDSITTQIDNLQSLLDTKRATLTKSFTQMQQILATLQSTGDFLTAQTSAQNSSNG
ncbi:MAG: flagellar filament capping protein FliD, partial [Mariprofundales bacterium]